MQKFKEVLLASKTVSVWGIGYLGYSTILLLQSQGFFVNVYSWDNVTAADIKKGAYPTGKQRNLWSVKDEVPAVDISRLSIKSSPDDLFPSAVHIIALPYIKTDGGEDVLSAIADTFIKNGKRAANSLVIFQAAGVPGGIEGEFIGRIENAKIKCFYASAFRSDWTFEEFFSNEKAVVLSGYSQESLDKVQVFYDALGIKNSSLATLKEAEIYENTKNSIEYVFSAILNQLSLAYPETDITKMVKLLSSLFGLNEAAISVGTSSYRTLNSINHLLMGANNPGMLSIIKESQAVNLSSLLNYADAVKRRGARSVTILGLSVKGDLKDIRLSPSLILAEYFNENGITVFVNDPFFTEKEIKEILPFANFIDIKNGKLITDAVFIMASHKEYRYFTQKDIERLCINNRKIIIDNTGLLKAFRFSSKATYHVPGDGKLQQLG
ncbi:MAG: hypothetical protein HQL10_12550 [Nitrospirae bacterium]|nr:hypothetical protein [Nitrospirota bacterium]